MRPSTRSALQRSAELTRENRLTEAMQLGEAAINQAADDEHAEIQHWLDSHAADFTGDGER